MEKILTGNDRAHELGFKSYREWILVMADKTGHRWNGEWSDSVVYARVDFGRWIADCEVGHASYVEPSDDLFYCYMCGNEPTQGKARHTVFPEKRLEIEAELMKRPVKLVIGLPRNLLAQATQVAMNSRGPLSRSWNPGESVETLMAQRKLMEEV
jgi:hypothetical protein